MKAFPIYFKHPTTGAIIEHQGMELRDYFAAQAIPYTIDHNHTYKDAAESAYRMADEMLKAREKTND